MPFTLKTFEARRPFLYHFTAAENLARITSSGELSSATRSAVEGVHLSEKRKKAVSICESRETVWLQTQKPLHAGNIAFEGGWQMNDLLACLNGKVFFWPGTSKGPIDYGARHFAGNEWPSRAVALRLPTSALIDSVLFCRYNSGSPRFSSGKASPRGPKTFLPSHEFRGTLSDVVEVVVNDRVNLPQSTQISKTLDGNWQKLFD